MDLYGVDLRLIRHYKGNVYIYAFPGRVQIEGVWMYCDTYMDFERQYFTRLRSDYLPKFKDVTCGSCGGQKFDVDGDGQTYRFLCSACNAEVV